MGLKQLDLFTDYELRQELNIAKDEPTRDYIMRLLRQRSEQRVAGNKDLFTDDQGRVKPGYMTTSELIAELGTEPIGTERYAELAVEAIGRADRRAFPKSKVPALVVFDAGSVFAREFVDVDLAIPDAGA